MAKQNFDDSIKKAKLYADTLDAINKKTEGQNKAISFLAQEMGIAYGGFIKQIEKSNEQKRQEIKLLNQANDSLKKQQKSAGDTAAEMLGISDILKKSTSQQEMFNKVVRDSLGDIKDIKGLEDEMYKLQKKAEKGDATAKEHYDKLKVTREEIYKAEKDANKDFEESILKRVDNSELLSKTLQAQGVDLSNNADVIRAINKLNEDGKDTLQALASLTKDDLGESYEKYVDNIKIANQQSDLLVDTERERNRIAEVQSNNMRDQVGLQEKLLGFLSQSGDVLRKDIWKSMKEYDQVISDAGKNFGFIGMKSLETSVNMASLGQSAARFGVSMGDAVNMMGELGDELKTIDQDYLANSVEHFMAIEKATGISSGEITTIAGEMMRAGKSAEQVESYMEGANKTAKMFGVNTKKILQGVAKNIDKMRQMGFQGGEESLTRMAARAERLNMNMDEMFDVAKRARSIEGAMEMASELQLAGGSFANIDPMSLLAAARKGPEELQKILTQMGGDIGRFNKETGQLEFDAVDADRLQMVADATGQTVDSIQKGLQKTAKTNQKLDLLGLSGSIDEDSKNFLADLTSLDKDGNIKMDPELSKLAQGAGISLDGVDSLGDLNQEQISALMQVKKDDIASLEEQAEQNQSFEESIKAFKDAIMNLFVVFEPFIKILTSMVQTLNGMPSPIKMLVAGLIGFAMVAPKLGNAMEGLQKGFGAMKSIVGNIKGAFGMGKDGVEGVKDIASKKDSIPGLKDSKDQTPSGSKGGLQSLAEGLKAMGDKDVFKGIGAVALAGPALLLMLAGMPTVLLMGVVGAMGKVVEFGFTSLARGISAMGQAKGLIKGAVAMVIVGAALIPFAFALQMMSDVSWKAVGIAMVMMLGAVVTLIAMGALLSSPIGAFLLIGALALVAVGIALMAFGASLLIFAEAGSMMQGMEFGWLGDLGWNLLIASPGLLLGGIALMTASPGLVLGSIGLIALGVAAQGLSGIDWAMFASIGDALLSLVPGLIGFSLAGLMFANPITLLGMLMMIGNLGMLATIITPLAESLNTGADGLDRFASGLEKLQAAANSLDFERLEALKELSIGMATSGAGGGIGDEIQKIADALSALTKSGGGSGGGGTKKIQVDLKLNGRDLQSIIIDDTEIVS